MARHFSKEEIEDIRKQLAITATHDTELPVADTVNEEDLLPFVQDGENKIITMSDFGNFMSSIVASDHADRLTNSRKIFNIPFDGTADVIGNGPTNKYPVLGAMTIADHLYPSFRTRELGGSGKTRPSYGDGDVSSPRKERWGAFYSQKICHYLGSNAWSIMKAMTPVGDQSASVEPVGAIVIKVPTLYNAMYTIKINSIYGSYAASNPTEPIINVIHIATSSSSTRDFRAKCTQSPLSGSMQIKIMSKPVDTENPAKGVEYYIVIGRTYTKYTYPLITLEATLVPGGEVGGPNPSYTWDETRGRYVCSDGPFIDDVYDYITIGWVADLSDYDTVETIASELRQ